MTKWIPVLKPDGKPRYLQIADALEVAIRHGEMIMGSACRLSESSPSASALISQR